MKRRYIRSQTPFSFQRVNRLNTLLDLPNFSGRSLHGAPVLLIHTTASMNFLHSASSLTYTAESERRKSSIFNHLAVVSLVLGMPLTYHIPQLSTQPRTAPWKRLLHPRAYIRLWGRLESWSHAHHSTRAHSDTATGIYSDAHAYTDAYAYARRRMPVGVFERKRCGAKRLYSAETST